MSSHNEEIMESIMERHSETCECVCCVDQDSMCKNCIAECKDDYNSLPDPDFDNDREYLEE